MLSVNFLNLNLPLCIMVEPVPEINGADLVNLLATDETSDHSKLISVILINFLNLSLH